jgi:alcohol dehydrogenase (cytochrome c)
MNAAGTRAANASSIDSASVRHLRPVWRFRLSIAPRESGVITATPVISRGVVYVQDMESNVSALRARDGRVLWRRRFNAGTPGPNGLAIDGASVFGSTDTSVFALATADGRTRWWRRILTRKDSFVDLAPLPHDGLLFTGTTGYGPGTMPSLYALDAKTGVVRWRFRTIRRPWAHPRLAGGGGVWQTPTIADGTLYAGTANPLPWGGSPDKPNGGAYPGAALFTDSLLALDARSGALRWYDQVTPHDVRDHDFESPPILTGGLVVGSGKGGRVIAWDAATHRRVWSAAVGLHRNDKGPLPTRPVSVCPGLLGGIETPGAAAAGRVFFSVVDVCYRENSTGVAAQSFGTTDPASGRGEVVALDIASGRRLWTAQLTSPPFGCATVANDVVFVTTYDGQIIGYNVKTGDAVWHAQAPAGINACPAIAGDTLYVAAGTRERSIKSPQFAVIAYRLGSGG